MGLIFNSRKVAEKRKAKKLTQEGLARRAELSCACIVSIEGGKREPLATTLAKVGRALQTKMEYFFDLSA